MYSYYIEIKNYIMQINPNAIVHDIFILTMYPYTTNNLFFDNENTRFWKIFTEKKFETKHTVYYHTLQCALKSSHKKKITNIDSFKNNINYYCN